MHYRCRGVVCRHGALRCQTYSIRLDWVCSASTTDQLLWPGRTVACGSDDNTEPVLSASSGMGTLCAGDSGDSGNHHRFTGCDLRRLFHHPAGDATRLHPPPGNSAHLGSANRPDLFTGHKLADARIDHCSGCRVRLVLKPSCRLRHCRYRNHAYHQFSGHSCCDSIVALESVARRSGGITLYLH
ncbi:hypothetical protein D3C71_1474330 [compost metagenome]